jgi:hypothetical protein
MTAELFRRQKVQLARLNIINNLAFGVTHCDAHRPMTPNSETLQGFYIGWCVTCVTCVTPLRKLRVASG